MLTEVYGVSLPSDLTGWVNAFNWLEIGVDFVVPPACIGSAERVLLLGALWPVVVICAVQFGLVAYGYVTAAVRRQPVWTLKHLRHAALRGIPVAIFITFLVLPRTARSIFQTWACESFSLNDDDGEDRSYMRSYWSLHFFFEYFNSRSLIHLVPNWLIWISILPLAFSLIYWFNSPTLQVG